MTRRVRVTLELTKRQAEILGQEAVGHLLCDDEEVSAPERAVWNKIHDALRVGPTKTLAPVPTTTEAILVDCDECEGVGEYQAQCQECAVPMTTANRSEEDETICETCADDNVEPSPSSREEGGKNA